MRAGGLLILIAEAPLVTLLPALGAGGDHLAAHLDGRSTALGVPPPAPEVPARRRGYGLGALFAPVLFAPVLDPVVIRCGVHVAAPIAVICAGAGTRCW